MSVFQAQSSAASELSRNTIVMRQVNKFQKGIYLLCLETIRVIQRGEFITALRLHIDFFLSFLSRRQIEESNK